MFNVKHLNIERNKEMCYVRDIFLCDNFVVYNVYESAWLSCQRYSEENMYGKLFQKPRQSWDW